MRRRLWFGDILFKLTMTNDATVVLAVVIFDMIIVVNKKTHKNIKVASSRQFLTALQHDILALVPMTEKVTSQLIDFDRKIITSLHLFRRLLRMYLLIIRDRLLYLEEREKKIIKKLCYVSALPKYFI